MATFFDEALKKAKAGNTEAQMFVAEKYFKGQGVMPSYIEALKWLEAAADKNKFASAQIAKMYREGIGVKKDLNKAFEIAVEYANKGNEIQMFELAGYYLNGIGVEANLDEALSWYEKAYNAGYLDAAYYLGYLYQTNNKIKDINKIIYWYNLAAEANNTNAHAPKNPATCKAKRFLALAAFTFPLNTAISGKVSAITTIAGKINVNIIQFLLISLIYLLC